MLTQKQQELVALLKGALPTAPPEVAQANVDWYKTWVHGGAVTNWRQTLMGRVYSMRSIPLQGTTFIRRTRCQRSLKKVYLEEWPQWVQPQGAHDAYGRGAKVTRNNKKWTSDVDGNTWEPGVYGWTEYVEQEA